MNIKFVLVFFTLVIHFTYCQSCNNEEFVLGENGETWLKVNNSHCVCVNFVGNGNNIKVNGQTLLDLQNTVYTLQNTINTLLNRINVLEQNITDLQNKISTVICKVRNNIFQTVTSGVDTKLKYDIVTIDTHKSWDVINNQYKIPISGYYSITGHILFQPAIVGGDFRINIFKNNINLGGSLGFREPDRINWYGLGLPGFSYYFSKDDVISLYTLQYFSVSVNITSSSATYNWLDIIKVI